MARGEVDFFADSMKLSLLAVQELRCRIMNFCHLIFSKNITATNATKQFILR